MKPSSGSRLKEVLPQAVNFTGNHLITKLDKINHFIIINPHLVAHVESGFVKHVARIT